MDPIRIIQMVCLLAAANGAPVIAKDILRKRFAWPVDTSRTAPDGRPWFGNSKTFRGLVAALAATCLIAPLLNIDWRLGIVVGASAMLGDLLSSFVKRRLGLPSSSMALGIDQVPESLLPTLAMIRPLQLTTADVVAVVAVFFVGELAVSRVLYWVGIRDRPY